MSKESSLNNQFSYWVKRFIKELYNIKNLDDKILNEKTTELSNKLYGLMLKNPIYGNKNGYYFYFLMFADTIFNEYITTNKREENDMIYSLILSSLRKLHTVLWLLENKEPESAIVIFRSLYESLIIILFLLKYPDTIDKFTYSTMYKLHNIFDKTNLQKVHDELMIKDNPLTNEFLAPALKKYSHDELLSRYGWSNEIIGDIKDVYKISFTDILDKVYPDENFKIMYRIASSIVHSTMAGSSVELMQNIIRDMVYSYIKGFCIPVFIDIFEHDLLNDKNIEKYIFKNVWEIYKRRQDSLNEAAGKGSTAPISGA